MSYCFPGFEAYKIPICMFIIWGCAGLNILGIVPVGRMSSVLTVVVIAPFLLLFFIAIAHTHSFTIPSPSLKGVGFTSMGLGLYWVMWNFLGWDNATTYAEEVEAPIKSYLKAVAISFVLMLVIYAMTILVALNSGIDFVKLENEGFPILGELVAGKWLGIVIAIGGMASTVGLFSAVLLSVSRVPKVMADDKLLSTQLSKEHPKYNTPYISIIICSLVVSILVFFSFEQLLIIDITIYGAALFLEYIALIVLRIKAPNDIRPFKIPLNIAGLIAMTILPFAVYVVAVIAGFSASPNSFKSVLFAAGVILSGEIIWRIIVWRNPKAAE
jgi:amino acid transporter